MKRVGYAEEWESGRAQGRCDPKPARRTHRNQAYWRQGVLMGYKGGLGQALELNWQ